MSLHVIATYTAEEGRGDELSSHLRAATEPSRQEPGCLTYRVIRSGDNPDVFVIVEEYDSPEAFDEHKESPHFDTHVRNGAWEVIQSREVVIGQELTE